MATAMACSILATCGMTACGGDGGQFENSETNAIVAMYYGGYGTTAMEKVAAAFNAEPENVEKGYTVAISDQGGGFIASGATSKLETGKDNFDLMLTATISVYNIVDEGADYLAGYDCALEDLTQDVYELNVPGENVKFKDKMLKQFYDYNTFKGKQHSMTWASGPSGIAYRADFFKANGWTIPRTTNEMIELAQTIVNAGYTPYIWSTDGSYWYYSVLAWWRQLIDDQEFDDFWNGLDKNGELSAEAFKTNARLQAFQELEKILAGPQGAYRTDGHLHEKSGTLSANETQLALYDTNNKICMMANSDWLENEMKQSEVQPGEVDIGLFKTPIISGILKKFDETTKKEVDRFETVKTEEQLRAVISSIDEGKTSHDGVSAADFAALKKIRSYTGTEAQNHTAIVPAYANAKGVAKEFLRYLATDKAMQIYYNETGTFLPFDNKGVTVDTSTTFRQDVYKMSQGAHYVSNFDSKNPLFYKTKLDFFMNTKIEQMIATTSAIDQKTGSEYWTYVYDEAEKEWSTALAQSKS